MQLTLAELERGTGLSRQTLRGWERSYGFPHPLPDAAGRRVYARGDLQQLRLIKDLLDRGQVPGDVVPMALVDLRRLALGDERGSAVSQHLVLLRRAGPAALRSALQSRLHTLGVARFIADVAAPLVAEVGEAWVRGQSPVFEEHACTEVLQRLMREGVDSLPAPTDDARPRVLLSSLPGEPHALGLLMAEAILALQGCDCISLGVQTPGWDLAEAAVAYDVDIVGLSFSGCMNPQQTIDGLTELRRHLPRQLELWAGGSAPVLHRRPIDGVWAPGGFALVPQRLADWRARAAAPS
ncbi:MAG: MerR family transcriptional regulator [Rubrivivax sp.]